MLLTMSKHDSVMQAHKAANLRSLNLPAQQSEDYGLLVCYSLGCLICQSASKSLFSWQQEGGFPQLSLS